MTQEHLQLLGRCRLLQEIIYQLSNCRRQFSELLWILCRCKLSPNQPVASKQIILMAILSIPFLRRTFQFCNPCTILAIFINRFAWRISEIRVNRGDVKRGQVEGSGLSAQPRGRRTAGRVACQRRGQQRHQCPGDALQVGAVRQGPIEDRLIRARTERRPAGGRERHRGAPGVHVRGRAAQLTLDALRGQVAGRAHDQSRLGQPGGVQGLGDAEVNHYRAVVGEHHVGRRRLRCTTPAAWIAASASAVP